MDVIQLLTDYNIPYSTEGKNVHAGWIGMRCIHCEDASDHLGWNLDDEFFSCWRCGAHKTTDTIAKLLNVDYREAKNIIRKYGGVSSYTPPETVVKTNTKPHQLPSGTYPLAHNHISYLEHRRFDSEQLEYDWHLLGTGPVSKLDDIDFKHRVIAPILWDGRQVSFQGRDVTGKSDLRYITCPEDREVVHHKNILYGSQKHWESTGIVCEGITDVWRFGLTACATFGIKYTAEQVRVIARSFKRVAVCFDNEPQAVAQANQLVSELKFRGIDAFRIPIVGDPGGMKQQEANYLVKQILI
jgi:DNA primase